MNFFKHFPQTKYTITTESGDFVVDMTDLTVHIKIMERLRQTITVFYDYLVSDGERPDTVSQTLYGTVNYAWVVLLLNGIFTLFDWPLNQDEFDAYIIEKYGSVANAQATMQYVTSAGFVVDQTTYNLLDASQRGVPVSMYDVEGQINEDKRHIRVVPPEFIAPLMVELKKVLAQ